VIKISKNFKYCVKAKIRGRSKIISCHNTREEAMKALEEFKKKNPWIYAKVSVY